MLKNLSPEAINKIALENSDLTARVKELKAVVISQAERILELESLANPYSNDGAAICNFYGDN